ncbi:MAG: glycosyltransferase family 2 protein [Phycisphaeraceae bacterium]|nr:glycosyltransferase family 2 protein [Phycisphaeraceae bacterium]
MVDKISINKDRPCLENTSTVSIIIVSYNTRDLTLECIQSVIDETTLPYELIVLDNNSSDGSADAIASRFPDVQLIRSTENHGFAGGNNRAAAHATADLILLLNPDTIVLDNAIDRLVAFSREHPHEQIWGGRTVFADKSLNPTSCWRKMTVWSLLTQASGFSSIFKGSGFFNSEAYGGWKRNSTRRVDIVTGCFLLVTSSLWKQLGGLDEAFFMYGEEADLCLRASKFDAHPIVCPDATIVHYGGASEPVRADKVVRLLKAKTHLLHRHMPPTTRWLSKKLLMLWPFSRHLVEKARSLSGRPNASKSWAEVWKRRSEWAHVDRAWK